MTRLFFLFVLGLLISLSSLQALPITYDSADLQPKPIYGQEIRVMSYILDNRHFKKIVLNDSLSSVILDAYIEQLDDNKTYFLSSDIASFEPYRFSIDEKMRDADVTPAYAIYRVFKQRYLDRMNFASTIINTNFDYSKDEYYETNREHEPWPQSIEEMNAIWKKIIKSQALSLKLAGKSEEDIKKELHKRYDRFAKNMSQFNSEDVFTVYANALTESYDPHTNYLSPQTSALFQQSMSLSLEGIGARLQADNDYIKIVNIVPGGPAQKSDQLHDNDLIVGVAQGVHGDMVDVIGWRVLDAIKLIKGPKGTTVRLQIIPAKTGITGSTKEVILVRDKIKLEDQAAKKKIIAYPQGGKNQKFGVISLPSFYMDFEAYAKGDPDYKSTTADVKKLIEELEQEQVEGILIDLRNNGGGSLPEAINLTGLFIEEGPVVQVKDAINRITVARDEDKSVSYDGPLAVITNRASASASEIFAGAIQDYARGIIIGEPTYGKGTVQTLVDLDQFIKGDEKTGRLKITAQKFYRITGSSTQNKGVVPDVILPSIYDDKKYGESAHANALPWDSIKSASFDKIGFVTPQILADLNAVYHQHFLHDTDLKKYIREVEELKKKLGETKISLNEEKRRLVIKQDSLRFGQADEEEIKKDTTLTVASKNVLSELDDESLREAILMLSEFIKEEHG